MAPTPSTRRLLDGVEVPVPPLDGASPSAFSTPHAIKCDSHTGDNLQMRQARDVRSGSVRLPIGVRQVCDETGTSLRVVDPPRRRRRVPVAQASGGKCRHCKEWYGGLRRISGGVPSQER